MFNLFNSDKIVNQVCNDYDDRYLLDRDSEYDSQETTNQWLGNLSGKSQYEVTELLSVANY